MSSTKLRTDPGTSRLQHFGQGGGTEASVGGLREDADARARVQRALEQLGARLEAVSLGELARRERPVRVDDVRHTEAGDGRDRLRRPRGHHHVHDRGLRRDGHAGTPSITDARIRVGTILASVKLAAVRSALNSGSERCRPPVHTSMLTSLAAAPWLSGDWSMRGG